MIDRKVWSLMVVILLAMALLAGCGGTPAPGVAPTSPAAGVAEPTMESPLPTPEQGVNIVVTDALGRTVEFEEPPERVVITGRSSLTIVETAFLFPEAWERIVGVGIGRQNAGDFLNLVNPAFDDREKLPPEAGPEQVAPLNPDAVMIRDFMEESMGRTFEQIDVPVVYMNLETPETYFRDLRTLGQLFDNEERAEEIEAYYQDRLDVVREGLEGLEAGDRPRVLLMQYSTQEGEVSIEVPSASWLQTTEVELAGGEPVWKEAAQAGGWTVVNFEQVAAWDPDKIFVIAYDMDAAQVADELAADPQWAALRAVQEGEIYGFPADVFSWDQPDPRWILGVTWLATRIHPDRFGDVDMTQEAIDFFEQMYGMDEAAVRAEILPRVTGDVE
ncbi:MAG TPA: ABC transporter substrate-binding protein [Anaerolineae bacterium]|nr:ABC transporter substrate-binding protein [Anaerolineae bacterium]